MRELSIALYLKHKRIAYTKYEKKQLLDDFCKAHNYHRKGAIRLLYRLPYHDERSNKGGKPPKYDAAKLLTPLKRIWLATDQMCGKRLKKAIPVWLPYNQEHYQQLSDDVYADLLSISASTIDRLLKPLRVQFNKGLSGTKPGSLISPRENFIMTF